jgi:Holliday junction resolvase-like predicted endonuclease
VATPEAAVDLHKRAQIVRAANFYRRLMRVTEELYRFDVVSIVVSPDLESEIEIFKDFFR